MIGGVTRPMLPHLPGVPHLHVNRLLFINGFSHYGSCFALSVALKQTLGARLATQKRECNPIFRHGQEMGSWHSTVGAFDDLGPVKEHLNGLHGSGSGENLQCSPKIHTIQNFCFKGS